MKGTNVKTIKINGTTSDRKGWRSWTNISFGGRGKRHATIISNWQLVSLGLRDFWLSSEKKFRG